MRVSENLIRVGAAITFIGFFVVLLGLVLSIVQKPGSSQIGGLIMIGPVPIAFGSSPEITTNMMWIGLLAMILYLFIWKTKR
ncbi:MAG: TIGR00304 family membrane protein [Methanosarcina sp.]|jgi:uncharacterized protein (TIGR00304 family)|uniref:TIGR00304 family membrane protein n=1 Tax=Methanosarcina sp. TaxID=2213 RepID=UPI003BB6C31B